MSQLGNRDCRSPNQKKRESIGSNASSYLILLNSLASDLDCMLSELCTSPSDRYKRSDVFLEPYIHQHSEREVDVDGSPTTPPPNPLVKHQLVRMHHVKSTESLSSECGSSIHGASSSTTTTTATTTTTNDSSDSQNDSGSETACDITLIERIIRSHPIWFLPGIQRAGAFHLLQGKEEGNFLVRQSSQSDTMALSVRLPSGRGPYIEHYLIQANKGKLSLETSDNRFDNIPSLIAHYAQCCSDELPVQLTLPRAMREAKNRQQLSSLALLGQEFWRYPMANPKSPESACSIASSNNSSLANSPNGNENKDDKNIVLNLIRISTEESTNIMTSIETTSQPTSLPRQPRPTPPNTLNLTTLNEPLDGKKNRLDIILSSSKLSQKLISPNLVQKARQRSPIVHNVEDNILIPPASSQGSIDHHNNPESNLQTPDLKTSKNTILNCSDRSQQQLLKTVPPPPPPRWAKSAPTSSTPTSSMTLSSKTVIILNTNSNNSPENHEQLLKNNHKILSPLSPTLKQSHEIKTPCVLSPTTPSSGSNKSHRRRHHHHHNRELKKNSQHYQESDILESYCRSSPGDKISDYEDIWNTTDKSNNTSNYSPNDKSNDTTTFMSPDSLKDTFGERLMVLRSNKSSKSREKLSYMEIQSPEFSSFKPIIESIGKSSKGSNSPDDYVGQQKRPDLLSRVCSSNSLNTTTTPLSTKIKMSMMFTKSESNSPMTPDSKINSPFYAEPADAIQQGNNKIHQQQIVPRRKNRCNGLISKYRHSEPGWFQGQISGGQVNQIDWNQVEKCEDKIPLISSSVDNLVKRYGVKEKKVAKPVQPPKLRAKVTNDTSWTVDSSWEFIGNEGDEEEEEEGESEGEEEGREKMEKNCDDNLGDNEREKGGVKEETCARKFPKDDGQKNLGNALTVQSIIFERYPELFKSSDTTESVHSDRNSSYDNVEHRKNETLNESIDLAESETALDTDDSDHDQLQRKISFKQRLDPLLGPGRSRNREPGGIGTSIRAYALQLAADKTTTFSQNIDNFIQCTMEGKEASPHIVMRNIRQFMSGMKNYLVKNGEREFEKEIEKERLKLKANEFLNLDAILEGVMMKLVVRPLREHVYKLFVEHYGDTGSLRTLADSIQYAQGKHIQELGIRSSLIPPSETGLSIILKHIEQLQMSDSPLDKLENLLSAISAIFNSVKESNCDRHVTLAADDLLPLLVWVLVQGKVVDAEIEAEFMWGLLHPSLFAGKGGYYLTTLSSAVHVLKTFKSSQETMSTHDGSIGTPDCCSSVLRVLVPDELHGSLNTRTLPVRPNMNTRDVCRILAHKIRCTNPQDYGLFKLVQGEETLLGDHECPQELSHCLFAFKRIDAKIAWPKTAT